MSCAPVTPEMSYLLDALAPGMFSTEVQTHLRAMPEWEQVREWGNGLCEPAPGELRGMGCSLVA